MSVEVSSSLSAIRLRMTFRRFEARNMGPSPASLGSAMAGEGCVVEMVVRLNGSEPLDSGRDQPQPPLSSLAP